MYKMPPQKYVIDKDNNFFFGRNWLHRDFKKDPNTIVTGGWWHVNEEKTCFYMYGFSGDFGIPSIYEILSTLTSGGDFGRLDKFDLFFSQQHKLEDALKQMIPIRINGIFQFTISEEMEETKNGDMQHKIFDLAGDKVDWCKIQC
jgi:hypothetical protein